MKRVSEQKGERRRRRTGRSRRSQRERGGEEDEERRRGRAEAGTVENTQQEGFTGRETDNRLTISSDGEDTVPQPQTGRELPGE